jgi:hypothetical protein
MLIIQPELTMDREQVPQNGAKRFAGITLVKDYKHSSSSLGDSEATPHIMKYYELK